MKKYLKSYKKYCLCFFILILIGTVIYFIIKSNILITLGWKKYNSNRVPLSFLYPPALPVTQCEHIYLSYPSSYEELIRFSSSCDFQSKPVYGLITVSKVKSSNPMDNLNQTGFLGEKINYKKVLVGNVTGYQLENTTNEDAYYYIFANGLKYEIMFNDNLASITNNNDSLMLNSLKFNP